MAILLLKLIEYQQKQKLRKISYHIKLAVKCYLYALLTKSFWGVTRVTLIFTKVMV